MVDAVAQRLMTRDGLPGMAVGVTVGGRSLVFDYGEASLRTHRPVTRHTLFEIGSISKAFTATLASYAVLRGSIALTESTGKFITSLRGSALGDIALLNLATHTAGGLPLQVPAGIRTNAELMRYFRAWQPAYSPGTYRVYSNVGIGFLGLAAARSMHRGFSSEMQRLVFGALGLRRTFLHVPAGAMVDYAQGYTRSGRAVRMRRGVLAPEAYGIRSTAGDMLRFLEANMGLIRLNGRLRRAILATHTGYFKAGALTQDLVWEQYRYPVARKTLLEGNSSTMLFKAVPAIRVSPPEPPRADAWINKTGGTDGFGAYVAFIPAKELGIVILANRDFPIRDRVVAAYDILTVLGRGQSASVTCRRAIQGDVPTRGVRARNAHSTGPSPVSPVQEAVRADHSS